MRTIILTIAIMLLASMAFAADIVQIATTRDASGNWDNPVEQVMTWDATIYPTIADGRSTSTTSLQHWAFPVEGGWLKATFTRIILGEYGIRWSRDGVLWSEWQAHTILKPGKPRAGN